MSNQMTVVDTPEGIHFYRLLSLRGRLRMEMRGLRGKGRSVASVVKEMFGLKKGCRNEKALARLEEEIKNLIKEKEKPWCKKAERTTKM